MFNKLFGKKEVKASKGYHSCVDTCEKDIANLETESENLRKDNVVLVGKVATLQDQNKSLTQEIASFDKDLNSLRQQLTDKEDRIQELEKRLEEADEKADGTPVKYASARKTLTKAKLKQLRESVEKVPAGATGFGGTVSVYDKKTKRVSLVEFKSKQDALDILDKAEKGNVDIIM